MTISQEMERGSKVAACEELLIVFWLREEVMIRLG